MLLVIDVLLVVKELWRLFLDGSKLLALDRSIEPVHELHEVFGHPNQFKLNGIIDPSPQEEDLKHFGIQYRGDAEYFYEFLAHDVPVSLHLPQSLIGYFLIHIIF